ncbi:MAG TPA: hypothetical protein VGF30_07675 [Bacteroidia bacterium]
MKTGIRIALTLAAISASSLLLPVQAQNKILFASQPFSKNPTPATTFKAGTPIYGQLTLEKPLKDYCEPLEKDLKEYFGVDKSIVRILTFQVATNTEDGPQNFSLNAELCLTQKQLENTVFNFDVMPAKGGGTTQYVDGSYFGFIFGNQYDVPLGKNASFKVFLDPEFNMTMCSIANLSAEAELTIDYTSSTKSSQQAWWQIAKDENDNAFTNALVEANKDALASVSAMPLPSCFSKGPNKGYTAYTNAKIIQLLKEKYGVSEIYNLTFDKPDGQNDFRNLVDANSNLPTCQMGNHVFYFAFKAPDGSYRFSGGVLQKDYIGYGKYGEAFVRDYSPVFGDEKYPYDKLSDEKGRYSVFLFDGSKLPK